jgi:hypothetical protein
MARRERDTMIYHAQCAIGNLDKALGHLKVMHDKYELRNLPHVEPLIILSNAILKVQEGIAKFRNTVI